MYNIQNISVILHCICYWLKHATSPNITNLANSGCHHKADVCYILELLHLTTNQGVYIAKKKKCVLLISYHIIKATKRSENFWCVTFHSDKHLYQTVNLRHEQLKYSEAENKDNDSKQRLMAQEISTESDYAR